jgi:hypothetical protein
MKHFSLMSWLAAALVVAILGGLAQAPAHSDDQAFRSALVFQVTRPAPPGTAAAGGRVLTSLNLTRALASLQVYGSGAIAATQNSISFRFANDPNMVHITSSAIVCVRGPQELIDLAAVDQLNQTATKVTGLLWAAKGNWVQGSWAERRYYSNPPLRYQLLIFPSAPPAALRLEEVLALQPRWSYSPDSVMTPGVNPGIRPKLRIPPFVEFVPPTILVPEMTIASARLQVWSHVYPMSRTVDENTFGAMQGQLPAMWLDEAQLVGSNSVYAMQPVEALLTTGEHHIWGPQFVQTGDAPQKRWVCAPVEAPVVTGLGPCDFTLEVVTSAAAEACVRAVVADETYDGSPSRPLDALVHDWDDLDGVLSP